VEVVSDSEPVYRQSVVLKWY